MKDFLKKEPSKLEKELDYLRSIIIDHQNKVDDYKAALNSCNMSFIALCRKFNIEPEDIVGLVSDYVGNNEYFEKLVMLEKEKHSEISDETKESIKRILIKE